METYIERIEKAEFIPEVKLLVETIRNNERWPLFIAAPTKFSRLNVHTALKIVSELTGKMFKQHRVRQWKTLIAEKDRCRKHPDALLFNGSSCESYSMCEKCGGCTVCGKTWEQGGGPFIEEGKSYGRAHVVVGLEIELLDITFSIFGFEH
jgi:hypothetical protein